VRLFLLVFFFIYGSVHFYFFARVRGAFAPGPASMVCIVLFLVTMMFAPILVHLAERGGFESLARLLAYAGYGWMGLLFLFFCASLTLDLCRLLLHVTDAATGHDLLPLFLSSRESFLIASVLAVCIAVYGYFEALHIHTERVVIESPKIPAEIGRIRLVQVSDVHLGLIVREDRLHRIIREINKAKPDLLVSTGDLVDGQINDLSGLVDELRQIKPKYGKFAVTGNHEYYAGIDQALDFTRKAGFTVLDGDTAETAGITIAGVDDPVGRQMGMGRPAVEHEFLGTLPASRFIIFLKHRPMVEKGSMGLFDLQLSGHIHKGQIFPFNLLTRLFYPVKTGFSRLKGNASLYVSRGTGTWGPPVRFLAPPEIAVIDLVHGTGRKGNY
jgi:predicted MPP superfamily phosphohydrolase